ncbi:MAG: hypothetical protein K9J12_09965 [Melioribacteraceae bacterium]|nr:hypothetical protein [Melioribacteraceae bacterium]
MNKTNWVITNIETDRKPNKKYKSFDLYYSEDLQIFENNDILFIIEGYILPRLEFNKEFVRFTQSALLAKIYAELGDRFYLKIKGVYNIIIIDGEKISIFNDIHSLKKFFIYENDRKYFISNSLKSIAHNIELTPSIENIVSFALLNHFVNGMTLFAGVNYSKPASKVTITSDSSITYDNYWLPTDLFFTNFSDDTIGDLANHWKRLICGYHEFIRPTGTSITLTGGNDSRMVLSGLLSNNITPNSFTFGDPESADASISKEIAADLRLNHNTYFVNNPSCEWFETKCRLIVQYGNSLINIHRAHRLEAAENEAVSNPESEMLFTGLVGGEYLKEPKYNDLTIPKLFSQLNKINGRKRKEELIKKLLLKKGLEIDNINIALILDTIEPIIADYRSHSKRQQKFIHTFNYYSSVHHTQDPSLFSLHIKYIINPFMDIDFLEKIASSKDWYPNKNKFSISSVNNSYLLAKITHTLDPRLSKHFYAKKGSYTGEEIVNQPFLHNLKRIIRLVLGQKRRYKQNFPLGLWLYDYCSKELSHLHPEVLKLFKKKFLLSNLESLKSIKVEAEWKIVTNAINISLNLKNFHNA